MTTSTRSVRSLSGPEVRTALEPIPDAQRQKQLRETLRLARRFLRSLAVLPAMRGLLSTVGYDEEQHAQGWNLVSQVAHFRKLKIGETRAAMARDSVRNWASRAVVMTSTALRRFHPDQAEFLSRELSADFTKGAGDVEITRLLDKLDALEAGVGREASSRTADLAALATLNKRGITQEERQKARKLVETAQTLADGAHPNNADVVGSVEWWNALRALEVWYKDWAQVARVVIVRKSDRISLGLARRARNETEETPDDSAANDNKSSTEQPVSVPTPTGSTPSAS